MTKKKKLGRVYFRASYVVDLDDQDMVDEAKECVFEDVCNAVKFDEIADSIVVGEPDPKLTEAEIPEFLLEMKRETSGLRSSSVEKPKED